MVANTFQGGRWGQEEVSSVFPLVLGEPFEVMGVGARAVGAGGPMGWGRAVGVRVPVALWGSLSPWLPQHCCPHLGSRGRGLIADARRASVGVSLLGLGLQRDAQPLATSYLSERGGDSQPGAQNSRGMACMMGVPRAEGTPGRPRLCFPDSEPSERSAGAGRGPGGPRLTGLCPQMEVSSDAEHFHVHAQEHKVLQFAHRHRPLAAVTRVQVLSDHRLAQVELARKGLSWG